MEMGEVGGSGTRHGRIVVAGGCVEYILVDVADGRVLAREKQVWLDGVDRDVIRC